MITIHCLPPELLLVIFKEACKDLPFERVLSHVDSTWRFIAFASASLWSRIHILRDRPLSKAAAIEYLKRSKIELLDGQIDCGTGDSEDAYLTTMLWEIVIPNAERWRSIVVRGDDLAGIQLLNVCPEVTLHKLQGEGVVSKTKNWRNLFSRGHDSNALLNADPAVTWVACEGHFPNLQRLRIDQTRARIAVDEDILPCGAPQLKSLHIGGLRKSTWSVLATTLTSLHLDHNGGTYSNEAAPFLQALNASPHLESLVLHGDFISPDASGIEATVNLPKMTSLDISGASFVTAGFLLGRLFAPTLDRLILRSDFQNPFHLTIRSPNLSMPSVRSLTIDHNGHRLAQDWNILQRFFPNVVELTAYEFSWWSSSVENWPDMHTLAFNGLSHRDNNTGKWQGFILWLRHRQLLGLPISRLKCPVDLETQFQSHLKDTQLTSLINITLWDAVGELQPWRSCAKSHHRDWN